MDKDKIIALLNQDLEGEHGAIIQHLTHKIYHAEVFTDLVKEEDTSS